MEDSRRLAFTARAAAAAYRISRHTLATAISKGELPAHRPGDRVILILRDDLEAWLRSHAIRPRSSHAEQRAEEMLQREAAKNREEPAL